MAVIEELIRRENDGTISFGNYLMDSKRKVSDVEIDGAFYKVKTFKDITKLEKNDKMLLETVPGATVHNLAVGETGAKFSLEGNAGIQVTVELEPDTEYKILIDDITVSSKSKTNMSGKIIFSVELKNATPEVVIEKL